jgi:replicative DNA helicase
MLLDREAIPKVVGLLSREDFYNEGHRRIFETIAEVFEQGGPADLITVTDRLRDKGHLDGAGGASYVTALISSVPTAANVEFYTRIVRRDAARRRAILAFHAASQKLYTADGQLVGAELQRVIEDLQRATPTAHSLPFVQLGELMAQPAEEVAWLLDGRLPTGGLSLLAGRPKAGKSTIARGLAASVARGSPWLGFRVTQGPVLYLALEEKQAEVRRHFEVMGARADDPIYVFCASAPREGLTLLRRAADQYRPVLIITDPLFKLVRVRDSNDYALVTAALEPLLTLARETGAHVLAVHHLGKGERVGGDAILGSTAIFAAVDTVLLLRRNDRYRTLASIQRYGDDLEEITLSFDAGRKVAMAGPTREEADEQELGGAIFAFLADRATPEPEETIHSGVEGRKALKVRILRRLVEGGKVLRSGGGRRGDPYLYGLPSGVVENTGSMVPSNTRERAERETKNDEITPRESMDSGSQDSADFVSGSRDLVHTAKRLFSGEIVSVRHLSADERVES